MLGTGYGQMSDKTFIQFVVNTVCLCTKESFCSIMLDRNFICWHTLSKTLKCGRVFSQFKVKSNGFVSTVPVCVQSKHDCFCFRIKSTCLPKISRRAVVFAKTFPVSINMKMGPQDSIRQDNFVWYQNIHRNRNYTNINCNKKTVCQSQTSEVHLSFRAAPRSCRSSEADDVFGVFSRESPGCQTV